MKKQWREETMKAAEMETRRWRARRAAGGACCFYETPEKTCKSSKGQ